MDAIKIEGLTAFTRAVKKLDKELPKGLRVAFNVAANLIIGKARPLIPTRSGKAAASLKASSTQGSVRITAGGKKAPYFPWLDFGGKVGRGDSVKRPFIKEGRYLYPTLAANRDEVTKLVSEALADTAKAAGVEIGHG
jgi:hypothetical protein